MNTTTKTISPLCQRMIYDMRMRKLSPKTQSGYLRAVKQFVILIGYSSTTTTEDLRRYKLHMLDHGVLDHPQCIDHWADVIFRDQALIVSS